ARQRRCGSGVHEISVAFWTAALRSLLVTSKNLPKRRIPCGWQRRCRARDEPHGDCHGLIGRPGANSPRAGSYSSNGQRARLLLSAKSRTFPHDTRSEEHTSELQSPYDLVCSLLLEKKK